MKNISLYFWRTFLSPIKGRFLYARKQAQWRRANPHNDTTVNVDCPTQAVRVGRETYGHLNVHWFGNPAEELTIGNCCSIAQNVHFLLGGEHDYHRASNFPFAEHYFDKGAEVVSKGPIRVEDDVWIGFGAIILSGVTLGRGCVVGAGSIVARDVPPYAVFAGGRIIRQRFDEAVVQKLSAVDYGKPIGEGYRQYCQARVSAENVDAVIAAMSENT